MLTKKCAIPFSFILLFTVEILNAQYRTTDFNLFGKVESVESITYAYGNPSKTEVSGFLDSEQFDSIYLKFDRRRNLILRENFLDYRGKLGLFDRTILQINPSNQLEKMETTLIQNGEEPRKISQRKIFYYLKNQLVRVDEFNSGRTSDQYWVANYRYKEGQMAEKVFWMEDEVFSRDQFTYNFKGNLTEEKNYHNNGNVGKSIDYQYNNDLLSKKITRSGNEYTTESFVYEEGRLAKYEQTDRSGRTLLTEFYDSQGLVSKIQKFNHKTQKSDDYSFIFELDTQNNWIKCEISRNQIPLYVIKRTIRYFN